MLTMTVLRMVSQKSAVAIVSLVILLPCYSSFMLSVTELFTVYAVQAYSSWMKGLFDFELEVWRPAMDNFSKAK